MDRNTTLKRMTERFLQWGLPQNFNPDNGIKFNPNASPHTVTSDRVSWLASQIDMLSDDWVIVQ